MRAALVILIGLMSVTACAAAAEEVSAVPAEPAPVALTGHQAIEAAQGTPHVLWFWGAN